MTDATTNAELLARSYKARTREDLTRLYDQWASSYDARANARNSAQPAAAAEARIELVGAKAAYVALTKST